MFELTPYTRFSTLGRLRRDMDNVWDRFFDLPVSATQADVSKFTPAVNVVETEDAFEITAEIPGLKPEEVQVTLTGDLLTIKGEKHDEKVEGDGNYHVVERTYGSFQRSFRLPGDVDQKNLSAKNKNGVLKIILPKLHEAPNTTIEIETE